MGERSQIRKTRRLVGVLLWLCPTVVCADAGPVTISLEGGHRFSVGDDPAWASPEFDDSAWRTLPVPGRWQAHGVSNYQVRGWHRIRFTLEDAAPPAMALRLGQLGFCADEVYLNGMKIGGLGRIGRRGYEAPAMGRVYAIPDGLLRSGDNLLAVRLSRFTDAGGILTGPVEIGPALPLLRDQAGRDFWPRRLELAALLAMLCGLPLVIGLWARGHGRPRENLALAGMFALGLIAQGCHSHLLHDLGWSGHFVQIRLGNLAVALFLIPTICYMTAVLGYRSRWWHSAISAWALAAGALFLWFPDPVNPGVNPAANFWISGPFDLITIFLAAEFAWHLVRARRRRESGSRWLVLGVVAVVAGFAVAYSGLLLGAGLSPGGSPLVQYGATILFVACLLAAAAERLADSTRRVGALSAKVVGAQEEERKRLARDLHDGLAQSLQGIRMKTQRAGDDPKWREVSDDIRHAIDELRMAARELRPDYLERARLADAMLWYADHLGPDIDIDIRGDRVLDDLPVEVAENLFRIFQEALSNAVRHGAACRFRVRFAHRDEESLEFIMEDDGEGFDPAAAGSSAGIGLSTMRERAELLGGSLEVTSRKSGGTRVVVLAPLDAA